MFKKSMPQCLVLNQNVEADDEFKFDNSRIELDNLICELITSETDFVNDLHLCQSAYILPLSSSFDVSHIFIKWDELIQLHEGPLAKLSSICLNSITMNDYAFVFETFQGMLSSLDQLYIQFCSQQSESERRFESKLVSDVRFKQQVNECQRNLAKLVKQQVFVEVNQTSHCTQTLQRTNSSNSRTIRNASLPLTSFMLKPMQRITKYSLLFDRMIKTISTNGPKEFEGSVFKLKATAQSLCNLVNEACRFKEDNEDNKKKLRWAQTHIKQTSSFHQNDPNRYSVSTLDSRLSVESMPESNNCEIILFDSNTNRMGQRKFVKSGCLVKAKSGKELVLFLFNDLILITQTKSGVSPLKVENIFLSTRAQQSYYKLYRAPILLEDIALQDSSTNRLAMNNPQQSFRSSWSEQQLLAVSFSDRSDGNAYNLLALNPQEKTNWIRELSERSMEARQARALHQTQQLVRPMLRKPSIDKCSGRLFVTILEIVNLQSNLLSMQSKDNHQLFNSLDAMKRPLTPYINSVARVCVQLQMKRIRLASRATSQLLEDGKREMRPMSNIFKTSAIPISSNSGMPRNPLISLVDGSGRSEDSVILINEECTQFMIENKATEDEADFLDIALLDDSKFRETRLIARRRVNIDQLISPGDLLDSDVLAEHSQINVDCQASPRLLANRPVEIMFKMKNMQGGEGQLPRLSYGQSYDRSSIELSVRERPQSTSESLGYINIKLRLHLQLFLKDTTSNHVI